MILENNAAFLEALEAVCDEEYESYLHSLDDREPPVFSEKHNKKMRKLISRQRKPYFKLICTAGRRVACIIVAIIVFSASAMSVKAIREAVFDFITKIFSDHNVVTVESGTDMGYPKTIEDEYCITELPIGFVETDKGITDNSIEISYIYEDKYIFFSQYTKDVFEQYIDNEQTIFENYIDADGQMYTTTMNDYDFTFMWDNGSYIFIITSNLNKDDILKLCKSTKMEN